MSYVGVPGAFRFLDIFQAIPVDHLFMPHKKSNSTGGGRFQAASRQLLRSKRRTRGKSRMWNATY